MAKPILTLTTDFGLTDHFVGVMKGVILDICPQAQIVDISHEVAPFAIAEGAYLIAQAYPYFSKDSVHIVVVDPGVGTARRPILVEAAGQYFVAPDNGVLEMIYSREKHWAEFQVKQRAEQRRLAAVANAYRRLQARPSPRAVPRPPRRRATAAAGTSDPGQASTPGAFRPVQRAATVRRRPRPSSPPGSAVFRCRGRRRGRPRPCCDRPPLPAASIPARSAAPRNAANCGAWDGVRHGAAVP